MFRNVSFHTTVYLENDIPLQPLLLPQYQMVFFYLSLALLQIDKY